MEVLLRCICSSLRMVRKITNLMFFLIGFFPYSVIAEESVYWMTTNNFELTFRDPQKVCDWLYTYSWPHLNQFYLPALNAYTKLNTFECGSGLIGTATGVSPSFFGAAFARYVNCGKGSIYNHSTLSCISAAQRGSPREPFLCNNISSSAGNPINSATGNKYQEEHDLSAGFFDSILVSRFYNSASGQWTHSYSAYLTSGANDVVIVFADGRQATFSLSDGKYSSATDSGLLVRYESGWKYKSPSNDNLFFSLQGELVRITTLEGGDQKLTYNSLGGLRYIVIVNSTGETVRLAEDSFYQLISVAYGQTKIDYRYGEISYGVYSLASRITTVGASRLTRLYHYEDVRNLTLLTGITDERGIRFATWSYDDSGRAISSQHSGGAGLTQIAYNADGSSSVTNELGKTTVYRYQQIEGVKRIIAVEGEPTPNCPASNSFYTYNDRGLVLTKTDAKGLVTTYAYNDRGLEISRTEASGTTLARTTTTEWDPDRFLPTKVVEPNRVTVYSYDNQGRELSRQSTSR
ncbi:DUF6531 domain-containing protein [Pseudomonas syringae]|uniref:YD repeat-containing protein n=1 Tax=Pseudomonas syringae pv. actinidiae TaxID=103796 RepID=A0A3M4KJ07_PSESF|nr:DUF6531 domain-containing protein [Pseudomonas syringae]RMQ29156.1 YD repeat-containing protein [Pseudomonas syringae pv. actinidiae]